MNLSRSAGAAAVAFALVGGLAGCGSQHLVGGSTAAPTATSTSVVPPTAKRSATELVKAMRASATKASSFQATGTIELDFSDLDLDFASADAGSGLASSDEPYSSYLPESTSPATTAPPDVMKVDVAGQTNGSNLRMAVSHNNGTTTLMLVDGTVYFRANKASLEDQGTMGYDSDSGQTSSSVPRMVKYADQWISTPIAKTANTHFTRTLAQLLDETISTKVFPDDKVAAATVTPIVDEGVPAYRITAGKSSLVVAADDAATLRYVVTENPYQLQTLRFSNWNSVPAVTAPADATPSSQLPEWAQSSISDYISDGSDSDSGSGNSGTYGYYPSADASGFTGDGWATGEAPSTGEASASADWATSSAN